MFTNFVKSVNIVTNASLCEGNALPPWISQLAMTRNTSRCWRGAMISAAVNAVRIGCPYEPGILPVEVAARPEIGTQRRANSRAIRNPGLERRPGTV